MKTELKPFKFNQHILTLFQEQTLLFFEHKLTSCGVQ